MTTNWESEIVTIVLKGIADKIKNGEPLTPDQKWIYDRVMGVVVT